MTTRRQSDANRANAKASTGPRSKAGKRKVGQNARRHGLTRPPPWDAVTRWYQIITNDHQAQPVPTSLDQREQSTLRLAEAEAQVARTTLAEREHLFDMLKRLHDEENAVPFLERVSERGVDFDDYETWMMMAENPKDPWIAGAARIIARSSPTRPAGLRKTMKTLTRYRRDAESARRRALTNWLEATP